MMIYVDNADYDLDFVNRRVLLSVFCKDGREYKATAFEVKDGLVYLYRDLVKVQTKLEKFFRVEKRYVSVFFCALASMDIKLITLSDGEQQQKKS